MSKLNSLSLAIFGNWFKRRLNMVFVLMLAALLVAEALVLQNSVLLVLSAPKPDPVVNKGVHVDFVVYGEVIKKVDAAKNFQPPQDTVSNPFRTKTQTPSAPALTSPQ